jgi:hypothetical protein
VTNVFGGSLGEEVGWMGEDVGDEDGGKGLSDDFCSIVVSMSSWTDGCIYCEKEREREREREK